MLISNITFKLNFSKNLRFNELKKVLESYGYTMFEAAIKKEIEINEPDNLESYSGQFKLRIPRSLHHSLAEHSQREGISMNQYCVYLLSKNDVLYSK